MKTPTHPDKSLPQRLFENAFDAATPQRSQAYSDGVITALERIFEENDHPVAALYPEGAADFTDFVAGRIYGHAVAAEYLATCAAELA